MPWGGSKKGEEPSGREGSLAARAGAGELAQLVKRLLEGLNLILRMHVKMLDVKNKTKEQKLWKSLDTFAVPILGR